MEEGGKREENMGEREGIPGLGGGEEGVFQKGFLYILISRFHSHCLSARTNNNELFFFEKKKHTTSHLLRILVHAETYK